MTTKDDFWLAAQNAIIGVAHNWNLDRTYDGTLQKRREGFTEHWGTPAASTEDVGNDGTPEKTDCWDRSEDAGLLSNLASHHPQEEIALFQYRPAWEEQLALRVAGLPHVVVNSPYAVTEATGPLPYLRDLRGQQDAGDGNLGGPGRQQQQPAPVLIGRNQQLDTANTTSSSSSVPTAKATENSILRYLHERHNLNRGLPSDADTAARSELLQHLVERTLEPCLAALRYAADGKAYRQVYREQSRSASGGSWLFSGWQAHCERVHALRELAPAQRSASVDHAVAEATRAFRILERQLQQNSSSKTYLMGTDRPVLVDVLLFGSLARALVDVHLVVVLADFPALCKYAQRIWDEFLDGPLTAAGDESAATSELGWREWNALENARNAFCALPMLDTPSSSLSVHGSQHDFHHAVEIMERLSLQSHDLHEQLVLAKQVMSEQSRMLPNHRPFLTFYRWRMGDDLMPARRQQLPAQRRDPTTEQQEKLKREYQRNDEIWLMTAVVTSVASLILFGFAGGQEQ